MAEFKLMPRWGGRQPGDGYQAIEFDDTDENRALVDRVMTAARNGRPMVLCDPMGEDQEQGLVSLAIEAFYSAEGSTLAGLQAVVRAIAVSNAADHLAAAPSPAVEKRCEYCDGTGDVHDITGEWHGRCSCPAGQAPPAVETVTDAMVEAVLFGPSRHMDEIDAWDEISPWFVAIIAAHQRGPHDQITDERINARIYWRERKPVAIALAIRDEMNFTQVVGLHLPALDAALRASRPVQGLSQAAIDVLAERRRQVEVEGWTAEHDDYHADGVIADAAAAYAYRSRRYPKMRGDKPPAWWIWDFQWWKPTTPRRDLVKAGALIQAEIERLDRAALASTADRGHE